MTEVARFFQSEKGQTLLCIIRENKIKHAKQLTELSSERYLTLDPAGNGTETVSKEKSSSVLAAKIIP